MAIDSRSSRQGRPVDAPGVVSQPQGKPRDLIEVHARIATEEERARLWPHFLRFYSDYELFERLAATRTIPVGGLPRPGPAPRCGVGFQANAGRHHGSLARGGR
jgi:hypothetical protein